MTLQQWLSKTIKRLEAAGLPTPYLDSTVLLADALVRDKSWLLAHPETPLQGPTLQRLEKQLKRRAKHEPLAYIRGKSEFYGREFIVNPHTLEPRPETETMINLLKQLCKETPCNIVDVGTGSGCLAVTAKLEFPKANVYATDIDMVCIETARQNAKKHDADIEFFIGDLLAAIPSTVYHPPTTILANLPYVPDGHTINKAAMFEPRHAIFGGADGLDLYRRLFLQIANLSQKPSHVLTESLPFQHKEMTKIANAASYNVQATSDFIQLWCLPTTKA